MLDGYWKVTSDVAWMLSVGRAVTLVVLDVAWILSVGRAVILDGCW